MKTLPRVEAATALFFSQPYSLVLFHIKRWLRLFVLLLTWAISAFPGFANAEQQPLRVGSEIGFPPYADIDVQGHSTGFAVELFTAVAEVMDIPVTFHPDKWDIVWQNLKMGKIDALPLVARIPEREGQVRERRLCLVREQRLRMVRERRLRVVRSRSYAR